MEKREVCDCVWKQEELLIMSILSGPYNLPVLLITPFSGIWAMKYMTGNSSEELVRMSLIF